MENKRNYQFISNFVLKVIAIVFMTLDHVGIFLQNLQNTQQIGDIFRFLGRLAFPLFIFIIVEGVRHTKHFGKYVLKLGIIASIFLIGQVVFYYTINNQVESFYSPILDVLIVAVSIYLLKRKDKYSFLAILSIGFIITSFAVVNIERTQNINILWMPFFLRLPYALFDILLALGFYYSKPLAKLILKNGGSATENLTDTPYERYAENIINAFVVLFVVFLFYILFKVSGISYFFFDYQAFAAFACIPLLFYNGKRGYDKKWFKYGAYLYLPLHILIIFLIFSLI
mgnify:CR=1 FL=1